MLIFEYNWDMFDVWSDLVQKEFLATMLGKESLYGPQILEGVLQIKTTQIIESKKCEDQRKRLDKIERILSDIQQFGRNKYCIFRRNINSTNVIKLSCM